MKTYIRLKQHKNSTPKHKTFRTTTEALPWNDQLYKITGGGGGVTRFTGPLRYPHLLQWFTKFSKVFGPRGESLSSQ